MGSGKAARLSSLKQLRYSSDLGQTRHEAIIQYMVKHPDATYWECAKALEGVWHRHISPDIVRQAIKRHWGTKKRMQAILSGKQPVSGSTAQEDPASTADAAGVQSGLYPGYPGEVADVPVELLEEDDSDEDELAQVVRTIDVATKVAAGLAGAGLLVTVGYQVWLRLAG